ncbi:probable disease resistance protein At5g63020 [Citrus sinensis]|uniref:probable disease resistance protein At5g63020 n=1 Tax=Citrus sinensis TaxID=2711 RepID=UPI00227876D5|nr:probable disease resistance protein At5g63020 [Citrus sinensis]XP_052300780.1 probable disease resistance protein At5g63020 [Citrus sinensis]XP_052300781.1 probable disease resistance protein At5g63020 [Citrus sinensis]XP_052300782.1 probable disease resistance protein At5g63020 [Citrus sinensis]XP_052300783.1 probable disease resistance protein At5g63020 [Citrus sinensis]XP_052300784.1 probable disease resistance protein At5g63020 [Citrus sinensis]XP_052300785.1 probable disease resistanc
MGSIFQITCDGAFFNRCLDCFLGKVANTSKLQDNLVALETELGKLIVAKNDVMMRIVNAERQQLRTLDQVQVWLSRVEAVKTEADELIRHGSQEIDKLCVGGYCSKHCASSYKFGKQVAKKLRDVQTLIGEGVFAAVATEVVPERAPEPVADERPTVPTIVGLQSQLEQVWRCLVEESVGIIGLYGMGGVGKTTLLTHINNKFLESRTSFDCVIWAVVSKDLQLEKIQEDIGKKIGLVDDSWKSKSVEEKALDIFRSLREKRIVLLLDDIWERVDLTKVGIPLSGPKNTTSKVVFTTRFIDVCGSMEADKKFQVACLSEEHAWELFRKKVGEETLESDHDIVELAQTVAKECGGLPLALITIGRAMACKRTAEEWRHAVEVLRRSASEFAGLGKEVYPLLKFSYDSLQNETIKSCFLYCCLYPEDYGILKWDLIDCWIGEGFLEESDRFGAENQGYYIVGTLVRACLLEEVEDDKVKMHDVIRDMAIWIACEIEKEKRNFLVCAGAGLKEAPDVKGWENVRRLSLMQNQIKTLSEVPTCPHLHTLFLDFNKELETIADGFFQFMPSLKVLKMSNCGHVKVLKLPIGMSELGSSLELLDISNTNITELPEELKLLVNLKCLNLRWTIWLNKIPWQLISKFSRLRVLRMFATGFARFDAASEDSVLFGGGEVLVQELVGLKYLEVLELTLGCHHALQIFLSSNKLKSCIRSLLLQLAGDTKSIIDATAFADLNHLNELWIDRAKELEELKIDCKEIVQKRREPFVFRSLHRVTIHSCQKLKDLTFLVFAPDLKSLDLDRCDAMEEIISVGKFAETPEMMGHISPFENLQTLHLEDLPHLKSIFWKPLPFTHLKEMTVRACDQLKKLPLDSNSAKERKFVIRGKEDWWNRLQWEDEATQIAFRSCFQPERLVAKFDFWFATLEDFLLENPLQLLY